MCMLCQETGCGIDAAVAHVRRRRIQGCLIRQVMIAKLGRHWERGTLGHEAAGVSRASEQVKARSAPQPAPAIPAQHVFLLLLPVIHSRRVGEARQGNVRQCKARQGNKAVLVHAPATPAPAAAAAAVTSPAPGPTRPICCFWHEGGTRTTTRRAGLRMSSSPTRGTNEPGPHTTEIPGYGVGMDGMFAHNLLC